MWTTGQVVDGGVQAQQDRAVGLKGAQALGDLVANVAAPVFPARRDPPQ